MSGSHGSEERPLCLNTRLYLICDLPLKQFISNFLTTSDWLQCVELGQIKCELNY